MSFITGFLADEVRVGDSETLPSESLVESLGLIQNLLKRMVRRVLICPFPIFLSLRLGVLLETAVRGCSFSRNRFKLLDIGNRLESDGL
jgi:hypothetical protein